MVKTELIFTFSVEVQHCDTGKLAPRKLLRQLDGVVERAGDLASTVAAFLDPHDGPNDTIGILSALPRLRLRDKPPSLVMELAIELDREPTEAERGTLGDVAEQIIISGWGLNTEWELPPGAEDYVVHIDTEAHELKDRRGSLQDRCRELLARLTAAEKLGGLAVLDDRALSSIAADAERLERFVDNHFPRGSPEASILGVARTARAILQQRSINDIERPIVSADNLDALDELPEDFF